MSREQGARGGAGATAGSLQSGAETAADEKTAEQNRADHSDVITKGRGSLGAEQGGTNTATGPGSQLVDAADSATPTRVDAARRGGGGSEPPKHPPKIPLTRTEGPGKLSRAKPSSILLLVLAQLVVLLVLFVWWDIEMRDWTTGPEGAKRAMFPVVYHDVMPLAVPWFGALGGVANALYSMTRHWSKWDSPDGFVRANERVTWNVWALLQGPIGLLFGSVSVLIVVLVTGAITDSDGGVDVTPAGIGLLCAISFAVGFRQGTFQELIKRTVDVIAGPTADSGESVNFIVEPTEVTLKTTPQHPSDPAVVTVTNLGAGLLVLSGANVRLTQASPPAFKVNLPGNLASGERGNIEITFDPGTAKAPPPSTEGVGSDKNWHATLSLSLHDIARHVQLTGIVEESPTPAVPAAGTATPSTSTPAPAPPPGE